VHVRKACGELKALSVSERRGYGHGFLKDSSNKLCTLKCDVGCFCWTFCSVCEEISETMVVWHFQAAMLRSQFKTIFLIMHVFNSLLYYCVIVYFPIKRCA
jgi:hypothetical protein